MLATTEQLPFHPLADLFPLLEGEDFEQLVTDIRENGLYEPIVMLDGRILDDRNRYRACLSAGVEPRFEDYDGDDPLSWVLSYNLQRRHLSSSQRACVAVELEPRLAEEAKKRQGTRTDLCTAPGFLDTSLAVITRPLRCSARAPGGRLPGCGGRGARPARPGCSGL